MPKYLVIAVVAYSAFLTLAMTIIGRRLIQAIAGKNAAEAQFRSIGSHLRERGKLMISTQGEAQQHRLLSGALDDAIARRRNLCFQLVRTTLVS